MHGLSYKEIIALYSVEETDDNWQEVRAEAERKAHKHIADWFRVLADHVENGGWPLIYGCDIPSRVESPMFLLRGKSVSASR